VSFNAVNFEEDAGNYRVKWKRMKVEEHAEVASSSIAIPTNSCSYRVSKSALGWWVCIYAVAMGRVNELDKYSLSELDKRLHFYFHKLPTHAIYDN